MWTHAAACALSVAGLVVLVVQAARIHSPRAVVACSIFGGSLILLYLASALYHGSRAPRARRALRIFDHAAIYVLIAGSYTPFTLVSLGNAWGWSLFGVVWGLAAAGIVYEIFLCGRYRIVPTLVYLGMGWLSVLLIRPLLQHVPAGTIGWLAAGGVAYTAGVGFYLWKRLLHHHAIWHLFVMAGSACHFCAVLFYVLPAAAGAAK